MKLQATIAISRLAEDDTSSYDHLREVLRAVGVTIKEVGCVKEVSVGIFVFLSLLLTQKRITLFFPFF